VKIGKDNYITFRVDPNHKKLIFKKCIISEIFEHHSIVRFNLFVFLATRGGRPIWGEGVPKYRNSARLSLLRVPLI